MPVIPMASDSPALSPVLLLTFNRPSHTARVWQVIRAMRPRQLWLSQDGPRPYFPTDRERCQQVREIIENVDWPCEVHRLYRDENAGCGVAVSSAIEWFLEEAGEGIILEDDTVPDLSFFPYCETLLEQYRDDQRIASISGFCYLPERIQRALNQSGKDDRGVSIYLTRHFHMWGWATWRDRWTGGPVDRLPSATERGSCKYLPGSGSENIVNSVGRAYPLRDLPD